MSDDLRPPKERVLQRKASFLATFRAVAWSFLGIRRGADYARDVSQLNPLHVVIAGIVGAAIFVALLVFLVSWVVGSGVAA
jgi:amino acid transporter